MDTEYVEDMLARHIAQFNVYDLERLEQCFEYEYRFHPENKAAIDDILMHIRTEMKKRQ